MTILGKIGSAVLCVGVLASSAKAADVGDYVLRGSDLPTSTSNPTLDNNIEFGARAWFSTGKLAKTLYAAPDSLPVSRLTYANLGAYSGEAYGRVGVGGWTFFKGYMGLGAIGKGSLNDQDFEPFIDPNSSTMSTQHSGALGYASLDYGLDFIQTATYRLAVIAGLHYLKETVNAYGCTQIETNPEVCAPGEVSPGTLGITQNAQWISARLGLSGDVLLFDRLRLGADAAWVPYTAFSGVDDHHLRTDIGEINETGSGRNGVQLETTAAYQFTQAFSLGAGLRYWRMTAKPNAAFVDELGNPLGTEPENYVTERFGAFVQAAYKFD